MADPATDDRVPGLTPEQTAFADECLMFLSRAAHDHGLSSVEHKVKLALKLLNPLTGARRQAEGSKDPVRRAMEIGTETKSKFVKPLKKRKQPISGDLFAPSPAPKKRQDRTKSGGAEVEVEEVEVEDPIGRAPELRKRREVSRTESRQLLSGISGTYVVDADSDAMVDK